MVLSTTVVVEVARSTWYCLQRWWWRWQGLPGIVYNGGGGGGKVYLVLSTTVVVEVARSTWYCLQRWW